MPKGANRLKEAERARPQVGPTGRMTGANRGLQAKGGRKGTAATRLRHAEQGHPGVDYPVLQSVPTKRLLGLITPGAADAPTKKLWPLVNLEAVLASCLKHGL